VALLEIVEGAHALDEAERYASADVDDVYVFATSGSTGKPKRVLLGRRAIAASARFAAERLGPRGAWLLALPAHYVAGFNVISRAVDMDAGLVAMPDGSFTATGFAEATAQLPDGPRYTSLVPAQLARLLDDPTGTAAIASYDRLLLGGQAADVATVRRARAAGVRLSTTYGMSETSGGCLWDGLPLGDVEIRLLEGVVHLAGSVLADGYLDDPELTAEAFPVIDGRRWHRTSDFGELRDGRLTILGRVDDVIVSGGLKVSLAAIESLLRDQPGFADSVVVRAADDTWGEVPVVVTTSSDEVAVDALTGVLGPAARPARIVRMPELPRLASGKPDRMAIRSLVAHR